MIKFSYNIFKEIKKISNNVIPISIIKKLPKGISFKNNKIIDNYFSYKTLNLNKANFKIIGKHNNQNLLVTYAVAKLFK